MRRTKLPKREARQQFIESQLLVIFLPIVFFTSLYAWPKFFNGRPYDVRGFSVVFALIFYVPVYFLYMWRVKSRAARVEFRRKNGVCVNCGYDLRGNTTGVCPECGEAVENIGATKDEKPAPGGPAHRITPRSGK